MLQDNATIVSLTAQIAAAYVGGNKVETEHLPSLIKAIHSALLNAGAETVQPTAQPTPQVPAVAIKSSIKPDYLVCLEDGKKMKTLKRHLKTSFGMTPEQYRAKWSLPSDYPMTAPNYSVRRSEMAKSFGLGRNGPRSAADAEAAAAGRAPEALAA